MLMENSATSSFAKTSQTTLADKAADKIQSGIRAGQDTAKDAGNALSSKVEDVRSQAGTAVRKSSRRVQSAGEQGLNAITEMVSQARDAASNTSDLIVAYTKKNPVKSLAIAAASGALLYAAIKAVSASRD
jgi:ElaB/YqjD/DUF883 family membrane-anchored ribosome-binding protein